MTDRTGTIPAQTIPSQKILIAGLASIAAAILANLAARAILFSVLDLPADFQPLGIFPVIFFTILGTGLGVLIFTLLNRRSRTPLRAYTIIAIVALLISLSPNFALMGNPAAAPIPGGTSMTFGVLIVFHIVATIAHLCVFLPMVKNWPEERS